MQTDFLAVGELLADLITTGYCDGLQHAETFQLFSGGSPANVVANLNLLGKKAMLVSCVGNDSIGKFLLNAIKKTGVPDLYIQVSNSYPTSIVLVSRSKNSPDFIAYRGADAQLKFIDSALLENAKIIHTTAFALSKNPAQEVILKALAVAKGVGKIISVDWNFAPSIWNEDNGKTVFNTITQLSPMLKISLDDMVRFFGVQGNAEECKQKLEKFSFSLVCLTCGKDGVWYKNAGALWQHQPAIPVKEVIDTTGAGDAFWAGFMAAFLEEKAVDNCITSGLRLAARKIQQQGQLTDNASK